MNKKGSKRERGSQQSSIGAGRCESDPMAGLPNSKPPPDTPITRNTQQNQPGLNAAQSERETVTEKKMDGPSPRPQSDERSRKTAKTVSTTASSATSASERLKTYNERVRGYTDDEQEELIPALAYRSYHLPGNGFCEDWIQFFANTHPLFGMCCHHRLHPVKWPTRLLQLAGSILFGLLVTNMIWLFFVFDEERDPDRTIVTVSVGGSQNITTTDTGGTSSTIDVTEGMVFLWTIGGISHALFDNTVWYLTACICCLPGRSMESLAGLKKYGITALVLLMIGVGALSSFLVVLRATLADQEEAETETVVQDLKSAGFTDDEIEPLTGYDDKSSFQFLISYGIELALALFLWFPLVGTVLFVGILGCGRVPVLGGRPYEVHQKELREERRQRREEKRQRREERRRRSRGEDNKEAPPEQPLPSRKSRLRSAPPREIQLYDPEDPSNSSSNYCDDEEEYARRVSGQQRSNHDRDLSEKDDDDSSFAWLGLDIINEDDQELQTLALRKSPKSNKVVSFT